MNSRVENGTAPDKSHIIRALRSLVFEEEADLDDSSKMYFFDGIEDAKPCDADTCIRYICYQSDYSVTGRCVYFPETDTLDRIKNALVFDEKVKEYLNPDAVAEFVFNCIDMNALLSVENIALIWDEPVYDEDGEIKDYQPSEARNKLEDLYDEYAQEAGLGILGLNWVDASTVIINVSELARVSREIAEQDALDWYGDADEWGREFDEEFRRAVLQTLVHEFRHAVFDITDVIRYGEGTLYPAWKEGHEEEAVEQYGNDTAENILRDSRFKPYINAMFQVQQKQKDISEPDSGR